MPLLITAEDKTRKLSIASQKHIGQAKVEGCSLQLTNIQGSAHICVRAETRGLERISQQQWQLKRGPFMRRYLDGYYPMQVSLEVDWPLKKESLVLILQDAWMPTIEVM